MTARRAGSGVQVEVWHDETSRWERTGQLDQGPCWCAECIAAEIEEAGR